MKKTKALLLCIMTAAASACSSDAVQLKFTQLGLKGRLERGSTVDVIATRGTVSLVVEPGSVMITPASAATVLPNGQIRLDSIGDITVQARANNMSLLIIARVTAPPKLWFHMRASGNRDIYSVSLDGLDLTRITTDPADEHDPAVSSQKLVYVSEKTGAGGDLYGATLTGASATPLTQTVESDAAPALSVDGTKLVFTRTPAGNVSRLWIANSDGSNAEAAGTGSFAGAIEADPTWCSNEKIVFMSTDRGSADLFLLQNRAVSRLFGTDDPEVEPSCNADGSRVSFAFKGDDDRSHIAILNTTTREVTQLTSGGDGDGGPAFLADGRIVFIRFVPNGATLMWLDPTAPQVTHAIPLPSIAVGGPAAIR